MSQITGSDLAHAALRRLAAKEGTGAAQALLEKLGIDSVASIPESTVDAILAECPELPEGRGVIVGAGKGERTAAADKKPSAAATLDDMGRDRNDSTKDNSIAVAIKEVIEGAPTLQEGLSNAARALHVRNREKAAK
jgi:hypothetical protein